VVPIRLRDQDLKQIDQLIELGIFQSRSDAIIGLIRLGIENLSYVPEISKALEKLLELEKTEGRMPIDLSGATRQLLEERERTQ
jgi:Arc/MetJ-type ribon-helix-helix transcriptional regulator